MTLVMQWSPWLQTILIGYNSFVFMSSSHLLLKLFLLLFSSKRLLFIALRIDRYSPRWKHFSRFLLVQAQLRCELSDHEIQYIPLYVLNTLIRFDCHCVEQCNDSCDKEDDISYFANKCESTAVEFSFF